MVRRQWKSEHIFCQVPLILRIWITTIAINRATKTLKKKNNNTACKRISTQILLGNILILMMIRNLLVVFMFIFMHLNIIILLSFIQIWSYLEDYLQKVIQYEQLQKKNNNNMLNFIVLDKGLLFKFALRNKKFDQFQGEVFICKLHRNNKNQTILSSSYHNIFYLNSFVYLNSSSIYNLFIFLKVGMHSNFSPFQASEGKLQIKSPQISIKNNREHSFKGLNQNLLISRTTAQSKSQSKLSGLGLKSPLANLSVVQIENLLLKYASQNEKLSKQRRALFQKNCQLVSQLRTLREKQSFFGSHALTNNRLSKNEGGSQFVVQAENFSLSHAIEIKTPNHEKNRDQLINNSKKTQNIQPNKFYSNKEIRQRKSPALQKKNFYKQINVSPTYKITHLQKDFSTNTNRNKNNQMQYSQVNSGKTIPINAYQKNNQMKHFPIKTTRAKNCSFLTSLDQQKTFIERTSLIQAKQLQKIPLQPTIKQQTSPNHKKLKVENKKVSHGKYPLNQENIQQKYQQPNLKSESSKKGMKSINLLQLEKKIQKLRGQNKKLRRQL